MTLLDNLTTDEWAVIGLGCVAVVVVPAIVIAGTVTAAEWLLRAVRRRRAPTLEPATLPTVPAAASAADIDTEWRDIESAIRDSK